MSQSYDIVIVGGGVVGLTAALAMVQLDFKVVVIDANELVINTTMADPRVYAINLASQELLERLGVWQVLDKTRLSPYQHMHVWDAANGAAIDFDARMVIAKELGHILEESILKAALLKKVKEQQAITLLTSTKVTQIQQDNGSILVGNEKEHWQATLLMIADGAMSPCRELLKVPVTSWSYHQQAIVALVRTEKTHQRTAYQVFNADGPLAFLPLVDEHLCSIVWSTTPGRAKELMALNEDEFNQSLAKAFFHKLGSVELQGKRYGFPLMMRHVRHYVGEHWLLLGDAAHTIHPLAGLGLNVGLADVTTWMECLEKNNNRLTKQTLGAYQRQRKAAVWQIITLMEGLKTVFANPLSPIAALRGFGLRLCNRFVPLKKLFITHAAGKSLEP